MKDTSRYFEPGYLDNVYAAGCKLPSNSAIVAGDRARRLEAELGSRMLLEAINKLLAKQATKPVGVSRVIAGANGPALEENRK